MRAYRRFSTVRQMGWGVCAFVALALMLESGGLVDWAQRMELGPVRTMALPMANAVHRGLGWMGLERVRRSELAMLGRVGWSDDPALLEEPKKEPVEAGVRQASMSAEGPRARSVGVQPALMVLPHATVTPHLPLQPMKGDPPLRSALPKMREVEAGKTRTVVLAGDSMMAVGLSSTMLREAPKYQDLAIVKAFKSGTGLARPEVFDWQQEYPAMLKDVHPDVVVVAIGANDGQGFVEDGVTYPFGSDGWKAIYERRVEAYLSMLESDGATVVWVGLPPMKADAYDARIALVNRIDYAVVSASPRAIWFSTSAVLGDADGRFQDFGEVHGQMARLRQQDGIHLSDDGAVLVAEQLLPWLAAQDVKSVPTPVGSLEAKR